MSDLYRDVAFTEHVRAAQEQYGSRVAMSRLEHHGEHLPADEDGDALTEMERDFIAERDGFYIASVSDSGWPYVQFRGGPAGFVSTPDASTIAWPDFRGNRQYVTTGNLSHDPRVAMIFMDYPAQLRLKVYGRATITDVRGRGSDARAALDGHPARVEREVEIRVVAYDWNCPQHIVPRYSVDEIRAIVLPLEQRLQALTAENARLREAMRAMTI
jgi:uncharacterized protein